MNNQPTPVDTAATATELPKQLRVPSIEMALNALVSAPPNPKERVREFVKRCVLSVEGSKQRGMLERAIMDTVNELGIRALDPASRLQLALNATSEDVAAAAAAQDAQEAA